MSRCRPAASCSGLSTGIAAMVVQFGLAMMPLGGLIASSGFTSETTSGTSGSLRQAEELSITIAPAAATFGANSRDIDRPRREQRQVEPGEVGGRGVLHDDLAVPPGERLAGRTGRGEEPDLVHREAALGEQRPHDAADLAGCSEYTNTHGQQA